MVYRYVREPSRGNLNENDSAKTVREAKLRFLNSVDLKYSIPYETLYKRVKNMVCWKKGWDDLGQFL
jgi:hypothetical protein